MLKFLSSVILCGLFAWVCFMYNDWLPWWSIAFTALLVGWAIPQRAWLSWISGFLGVAIVWLWLVARMDLANDGLLVNKMTQLLPVGGSGYALMGISSLLGGLLGGMGALTGAFLRKKPAAPVSQ